MRRALSSETEVIRHSFTALNPRMGKDKRYGLGEEVDMGMGKKDMAMSDKEDMGMPEAEEKEMGMKGRATQTAVIAVNDDVGDGFPIPIRELDLERYKQNPVVLWSHDHWDGVPVGRTTAMKFDNEGKLIAEFEFNEGDELADRLKHAWEGGFLSGASIGAYPRCDADGKTRYELLEWSLVSIPKDPDAVTMQRNYSQLVSRMLEGEGFDAERVGASATPAKANADPKEVGEGAATVAEKEKEQESPAAELKRVAGELKSDILSALREEVPKLVRAELAETDDKPEEADEASEADEVENEAEGKQDGTEEASEEQASSAPAEDHVEVEGEQDDAAAEAAASEAAQTAAIDARQEIVELTRNLLPKGMGTRGRSNRELLLAAVGDEVEDPDARSDDYLMGRAYEIKRRRDHATNSVHSTPYRGSSQVTLGAPLVGSQIRQLPREVN